MRLLFSLGMFKFFVKWVNSKTIMYNVEFGRMNPYLYGS